MLTSKLTQLTCKTLKIFRLRSKRRFLSAVVSSNVKTVINSPINLLKCVFLNTYLKKRI